jgi:catechol 2,3-dioxygenase-like lactoylglutathione lyase family enzyme
MMSLDAANNNSSDSDIPHFDVDKAKEFYVSYLGFSIDWEHRFEDNTPLYIQVSLGSFQLHLSEHHGDGCPGSTVFVRVTGLDEYHRELSSKNYRYLRPGINNEPWGARSINVIDPFGNRIRFNEYVKS